jgi:hypothetical protein
MTDSHSDAHRLTRRGALGAGAALGVVAAGGPAALAATAAGSRGDQAGDTHVSARAAAATGERQDLWGVSSTGEGTGVRGNGRLGVLGEGTHTGVAGDGYIGVRGTTSGIHDGRPGVGVWAQAETPGGVALRTDGPAEFSGATAFARSGVVTVPSGSRTVTKTEVALAPDTVILATLQTHVPGVCLHAVETDPMAGSFTVFITDRAAVDVRIGWLALG